MAAHRSREPWPGRWRESRAASRRSCATASLSSCTRPARLSGHLGCGSIIDNPMKLLFALPGLHRFARGAEVVFESIAQQIAAGGEHQVTVVGSGQARADRAYNFIHVPAVSRERFEHWPKLPFLRNEFMYEELTFAAGLALLPAVNRADVTTTCGYPYTNWALRRPR